MLQPLNIHCRNMLTKIYNSRRRFREAAQLHSTKEMAKEATDVTESSSFSSLFSRGDVICVTRTVREMMEIIHKTRGTD